MSIDDKIGKAYLTKNGWIEYSPVSDEIKAVAVVKLKQPFMDSDWHVSILKIKKYATDDELEVLYQKYGRKPPGDLDW